DLAHCGKCRLVGFGDLLPEVFLTLDNSTADQHGQHKASNSHRNSPLNGTGFRLSHYAERCAADKACKVAQCREYWYHRGPQDYGRISGFGQGGAITIVFAPSQPRLEQILKTVEIQLQNRGA